MVGKALRVMSTTGLPNAGGQGDPIAGNGNGEANEDELDLSSPLEEVKTNSPDQVFVDGAKLSSSQGVKFGTLSDSEYVLAVGGKRRSALGGDHARGAGAGAGERSSASETASDDSLVSSHSEIRKRKKRVSKYSDWAACKYTRLSCSVMYVAIAGCLFLAKSMMQKSVALSSMEAELMAMTECAKTVILARKFLQELSISVKKATPIHIDNQSCIQFSASAICNYRNRHIPIRYFWCKQLERESIIMPTWIDGSYNTSDLFTKNVTKILFLRHSNSVGVRMDSDQ